MDTKKQSFKPLIVMKLIIWKPVGVSFIVHQLMMLLMLLQVSEISVSSRSWPSCIHLSVDILFISFK